MCRFQLVVRVLILALVLAVFSRCALLRPHQPHDGAEVIKTDVVESQPLAAALDAKSLPEPDVLVSGVLERNDLKAYEKIMIHLPYADVALLGNHPGRMGKLSVKRLIGDSQCRIYLHEREGLLELSGEPVPTGTPESMSAKKDGLSAVIKSSKSSIPVVSSCRFAIDIALHEAADLSVDLKRGSIFVENWAEPIDVKLGWGDVDVGSVGEVSVLCGRCTFSGDGLSGSLHYKLESGNVGLAGLGGSVEGYTLGDTVLKWRKLKANSVVNLASQAGDVILFFPTGTPLAVQLDAPRGDVHSALPTGHSGIPVSVKAELGNVRLYRNTLEPTN